MNTHDWGVSPPTQQPLQQTWTDNQPKQSKGNMIGSLISGGASIVGGAIDAISNAINHKRDLKAQQEENQKNREHAEAMYKKYESPQAQAAQLSAAGLNPAAQGAVSTQSVGSASTSSLPTSQPSSLGSSIAEGASEAVNGYAQRKQFQQQLDLDALSQTQHFLVEMGKLDLSRDQLEVQLDLWREQIEASKTSRKYQRLINKELQDFLDSGGNRFIDDSNFKFTQIVDNIMTTYTKVMDESRKADLHKFEKDFARLRNENLSDIIYDHTIKEIGHTMGVDLDSTPAYLRGFACYAILCKAAFDNGNMSYNDYKKSETALQTALTTWEENAAQFADPNSLTAEARQRLYNEQTRLMLDLFKSINPLSALSD